MTKTFRLSRVIRVFSLSNLRDQVIRGNKPGKPGHRNIGRATCVTYLLTYLLTVSVPRLAGFSLIT